MDDGGQMSPTIPHPRRTRPLAYLRAPVVAILCACATAWAGADAAWAASGSAHPAVGSVAPVAHAALGRRRTPTARSNCRRHKHNRRHLRGCRGRAAHRALHRRRISHARRSHAGRSHAAAQRVATPASSAPTITLGPPPQAAATIASVLATPCQNTNLTPEAGNVALVEAAALCLIDQERARNGELPLQPNAQLQQAAQTHSDDMVGEDYFSHVAPDGETPLARVEAAGYLTEPQAGYTVGENIAWGTLYLATPSAIVAAWIASPEHLANILEGAYRDTAIAVAPAVPPSLGHGQPGAVYTQEFGVVGGS
jgi:uncharacterized protein YkwD